MKKHTLFVGLNSQKTRKQEIPTMDAIKLVGSKCGDCTVIPSTGFYTHRDGEVVEEVSLKIELLFKTDATVKAMVEELKEALDQESIAVQTEEINSILI